MSYTNVYSEFRDMSFGISLRDIIGILDSNNIYLIQVEEFFFMDNELLKNCLKVQPEC